MRAFLSPLWMIAATCLGLAACADADPTAPTVTLMDGGALGTDLEAPTWENFALPFFESYCVGCHADFRNYTTREHVSRDVYFIRCKISPKPLILYPHILFTDHKYY